MHIPAGSSPEYLVREHRFRFLLTGAETNGTYSAMEFVSPIESGPSLHLHEAAEEHFLILEGELRFEVADETFIATAGDFVHVPRQSPHRFTVLSKSARVFASFTPAGEELAFIENSTPLS